MSPDFSDPTVRKIIKIYLSYHHAIHTRALREGRPYILRALYAELFHEGFKTQIMDCISDESDSGHLIVDKRITVWVVCVSKLDPEPVSQRSMQFNGGIQTTRLVLNFGSSEPDYYPQQMDTAEQLENFWEEGLGPEEDELDYVEDEAKDVP